MVRGPVTLIVGLIYALMLSRPLATVFAIILPVLAIVLGVITYRVSPLYRQLQTSMDHLNGVVQEDLTAVRAVKAYVRTEHEEAKFDTVNTELARTATKTFGSAVLNRRCFMACRCTWLRCCHPVEAAADSLPASWAWARSRAL